MYCQHNICVSRFYEENDIVYKTKTGDTEPASKTAAELILYKCIL